MLCTLLLYSYIASHNLSRAEIVFNSHICTLTYVPSCMHVSFTVNHLEKPVSDLATMYRSQGTYEDNVCRCFVAMSDVHVRTDGEEYLGMSYYVSRVVTALLTWLLPLHFVWLYSQAMIDAVVFSCIPGTVLCTGNSRN